MHDWIIGDRTLILQTPRWSVERSNRRRSGQSSEHEFFTINIADFVNVIALTKKQEIVMVRQFRHGVEHPTIEMPGGLIDPDEHDIAASARRELLEETGYDGDMLELGVVHPNPALLKNRCHFFIVPRANRVAAQNLEETEDAHVLLIPRERINGMIKSGEISNALMIAGLKLLDLWEDRQSGPHSPIAEP